MDALAGLRGRLAEWVGPALDPLYAEFRARYPDADVALFLARLRKAGRLTDEQVTDLLLREEPTITLSEGRSGAAPAVPRSKDGRRLSELGLLGAGAMGEVWLAADPDLRRQVAVKRLHPDLMDQEALVRRFRAEAQITAQLDHPGIMPVYSFDRAEDGQIEYAMKLIRGRTLDDVLHEARKAHRDGRVPDDLSLPARLELFLHVCDAMAYAHERGVVHRDLKPENIMVGSFHEVTVMDWGIAKLVGTAEDTVMIELGGARANETQVGVAIGTPPYMSPEQALGENDVLTGASDQYALGLILAEVVTLRRIVTGATVLEILYRAQEAERDPLRPWSKLEPVPKALVAIVDKACAPDPADRYPSVAHLADDVRRSMRDEPISARPDTAFERLQRWVGRHRTLMINAVLALILAMVVGAAGLVAAGVGLMEIRRGQAEAEQAAGRRVMGRVADQGHQIDAALQRYEALLTGLAFATEQALSEPAPATPYFVDEDFLTEGQGPPDLRHHPRFRADVSMDSPMIKLAPGVDRAAVEPRIHQLASAHPRMWRAIVESGDPALITASHAEQVATVGGDGVPVVWAIAGVEEGVLVGVPGKGGYPDGYDPRVRPWYTSAKAAPGVQWDEPYVDASGMGLLVSCSLAVRDHAGVFLGAAALDLDIDMLVAELLAPGDLVVEGAESFLVDDEGNITLRSSLSSDDLTAAGTEPVDAALWAAVAVDGGRTGMIEHEGSLVAWVKLASVDWAYVVVGPRADLLEGPGAYAWWW